jgi:transcriptional antiterminator RfaH
MPLGKMNRWICLFTQPVREQLAQASLVDAGFEVFLPVYKKSIVHARRRSEVLRPLFPRYVFARPRSEDCNLASAYRLTGVSSFAGPNLAQSIVCDAIMDTLRRRQDADGVVHLDFGHVKPGQKVQVTAGPFAGFEAAFSEPNDQKRSWIFISLLGKANKLLVSNHQIEIAA